MEGGQLDRECLIGRAQLAPTGLALPWPAAARPEGTEGSRGEPERSQRGARGDQREPPQCRHGPAKPTINHLTKSHLMEAVLYVVQCNTLGRAVL